MRARDLSAGILTVLMLVVGLALTGSVTGAAERQRLQDGSFDTGLIQGIAGGGDGGDGQGKVVVADRGSGTISVISAKTDELIGTYALPTGDNPPEPMYVYATPFQRRVFVGDRANDRVVAFDSKTFEVVGMAATDRGVFHMWGSTTGGELWVNCDVDNTTTVIDMRTLETVASVPTPADLVALGGKPHDVIISPDGAFAYVTVLGLAGGPGYVVQFDADTFEEIGRAEVGDDPHLSLTPKNRYLYVPSQGGGAVHVLDRFSLAPVTEITVPGAHGAGMSQNGRYFYTTNLPGGGIDALWTIDTKKNKLVGMPTDSPYGVPHNIALATNGRKLYLTHSGPNNKVTVYRMRPGAPVPEYLDEVTVGMNPFGIAYVQ